VDVFGRRHQFIQDMLRIRVHSYPTVIRIIVTTHDEYFGDVCEKRYDPRGDYALDVVLNLTGEAENAKLLERTFAASGFEAAVHWQKGNCNN